MSGFMMMSMNNIQKFSTFVPVTLVQEDWLGIGNVNGRTPSPISGDGTWQVVYFPSAPTTYFESGYTLNTGQPGATLFRHSVARTDASIIAEVIPVYSSAGNAPVIIWARSTPGPNNEPDTGYYVECSGPLSGLIPIILVRRVAGGDAIIGTSGTSPQYQIVSFTVAGSTITVKVNGTTVIQVTDTQVSNAGYWGYSNTYFGDEDADSISRVGPILIQAA